MNIRQLARLAKVSPATVSFALRGSPKISPATRERIRKLAHKTGYTRDARLVEIMRHLRKPAEIRETACFAVVSFHDNPRPWEESLHLSRVHAGMQCRASELGYRLEPLWLRSPGMTNRRFSRILYSRGIEGVLCFGSPVFDEEFPAELNRCAIVTEGLSIRTPLHRVISDSYNDTLSALTRLYEYGYRRPGLVIGHFEELRGARKHSAAYLGWCEQHLGHLAALPIMRLEQVESDRLIAWLEHERPDSIIFVHESNMLKSLQTALRQHHVRVPQDLGVLVISPVLEERGFAAFQENQGLMGTRAVELLAARVANRDLGIPTHPRVEMVESIWNEGASLPRLK